MVDHYRAFREILQRSGRQQINIRAIAQGSSERNISVVIDSSTARKALRAVHAAFYLSNQTISIGIIGSGLIGGTFLDQLQTQMETLKKEFKIDLRVRGILNSKTMVLSERSLPLENWRESVKMSETPNDLEKFAGHIQADHLPHAVILDCTSSAELTANYPQWLERGIHIITPNKKANTGTMEFYRTLRSITRATGRHYLYETTVGAGLPIINTLRDLVQTGDQVLKIEGALRDALLHLQYLRRDTALFPKSSRRPAEKATPNRIRATTSRVWTLAESW